MATYFEAIRDDGREILNDSNNFLVLTRCGALSSIATYDKGVTYEGTSFGGEPIYSTNDKYGLYSKSNTVYFFSLYTLTLRDNEKVIALRPANYNDCGFHVWSESEKIIKILIMFDRSQISTRSYSLTVYVFGELNPNSAMSNSGLQIFNAEGKTIFHSDFRLLNIVENVSIDAMRDYKSLPLTYTLCDANNKAILYGLGLNTTSYWDGFSVGIQASELFVATYGLCIIDNKISYKLFASPSYMVNTNYIKYTGMFNQRSIVSVIDVTNYPTSFSS